MAIHTTSAEISKNSRDISGHLRGITGHLPGNRKVPGLMPGQGFLLLLFPWARNFTPICLNHPAVKLGHIVY